MHKFREFQEAGASALYVNTSLLGFGLTELAEAGDSVRIGPAMTRAHSIGKRTPALRSPQNAIDRVRARPVLDNAEQEIPVVWIVETACSGRIARQLALLKLVDIRQVFAKHVFKPADCFDASLASRRQDFFEHVIFTEIGSAKLAEGRIF